jgi:hypothetical protein
LPRKSADVGSVDHQGTITAWKRESAVLTSPQEMANPVMRHGESGPDRRRIILQRHRG